MAGGFAIALILGAATGAAAVTPAKLRSGSIIPADYPADALAARAQGTTAIRYTVHEQGRVAGCAVTATSGHVSLDNAACAIVQRRFRFSPARDAAGTPISESRSDLIAWTLPGAVAAADGKKPASD
jgi:protein TonB